MKAKKAMKWICNRKRKDQKDQRNVAEHFFLVCLSRHNTSRMLVCVCEGLKLINESYIHFSQQSENESIHSNTMTVKLYESNRIETRFHCNHTDIRVFLL